jgi:Tfp pilus assembly ATPase PilU
MIDVNAFLEKMVEMNSSDLFLKAGRPPSYKIAGIISQIDDEVLSPGDMEEVADFLLSDNSTRSSRVSVSLTSVTESAELAVSGSTCSCSAAP